MKNSSGQDKLDQIVTPILSEEMGTRLKLVRMKMLLDQREMGDLLGISQQQMSKLEAGKLDQAGFTLARFKAVFGKFYTFILFGSQVSSDNWGYVRKRYWDVKLKVRRKQGSGAWKKQNTQGSATEAEVSEGLRSLQGSSGKKGS